MRTTFTGGRNLHLVPAATRLAGEATKRASQQSDQQDDGQGDPGHPAMIR